MLEPSFSISLSGSGRPALRRLQSEASCKLPNYPSAPAIDRREFQAHPVADQHPDEIPVDAIGNVRRDERPAIELHAIKPARKLCLHAPDYFRAATGTSLAVRIHGPSAVTATVCSKCADRLRSRVIAVQPSDSTLTAALPAFTIGSIASTMPSASRGPRPGSP